MFKRKKVFKILITGSFGSGKTTLVRTLSQIEPVLTEKRISSEEERTVAGKETTTVAMDVGKLKISDDLEVHLFSTPGQERFSFMFDVLSKGIIGALILVDATNRLSMEVAKSLADKVRELYGVPIVFGVTKLDLPDAKSLEEIRAHLEDDDAKVVPLDPRRPEDGKRALLELLSLALEE
ncbi:MAG: GTP-binding protein [Aquificae bacterium]|nr:GTP-binding protein [Aquificota bacterium]